MVNTLGLLIESNVTTTSTSREQVVFNALLDSFLQATRNLYHFLCSYKPRASDIIAENFFDDKENWSKSRPTVTEFQKGSLAVLISKRLFHLTWDRASRTKPSWGPFRIAWELCKVLEVFVGTAPPSRLDPSLSKDVEEVMLDMRQIIDQYGGIDLVESFPLSKIWNENELSMGTLSYNTNMGSKEDSQ